MNSNNNIYFYTETAFHHMGDFLFLKDLINQSKNIGASGVKFQVLLNYDSFLSEKHSMYEEFKKGLFSLDQWQEIFQYTNSLGLDVIFMPLCTKSFELIESNNYKIKYIDIHSVSFYDNELLNFVEKSKIPIILGVGGRTSNEIDQKILKFGNQIETIMVGFQAFPSLIEDIKIGKIAWLKNKYPSFKIGYADHSSFDSERAISSNEWALLLGASVFEKHITSLPGEERWDFQSALSIEKAKELIKKLNYLANKVLNYSYEEFDKIEGKELIYRNRQKVLVASKILPKGHQIVTGDLDLKMLDSSDGFVNPQDLIGRNTTTEIQKGERIYYHNINFNESI